MKKTHLYFIILLSIVGCTNNRNELNLRSDLTFKNLRGNVRELKTVVYHYYKENDSLKMGQMDSQGLTFADNNEFIKFNKLGYILIDKKFRYADKLSKETIHKYDSKNRLEEIIEMNADGIILLNYKYFYSKNDSLERMIYTHNDFQYTSFWERMKNNRVIKKIVKMHDTIQMTYISEINENGNVTKENSYIQSDIPAKFISRTYEGKLLKSERIKTFSEYDTIVLQILYEYNEINQLIKVKSKDNFSIGSDLIIYTYDENSNLLEKKWEPSSTRLFFDTERFDKYGNLIERTRTYKDNGEIDSDTYRANKYLYDENGNWIEKKTFINKGDPKRLVKREIKYYK